MTKTRHPAEGCTKAQREAFEAIAVNMSRPSSAKTLDALEAKGLIAFRERVTVDGGLPLKIRDPYVPLGIHAQWCAWCDENIPDDEEPVAIAGFVPGQ